MYRYLGMLYAQACALYRYALFKRPIQIPTLNACHMVLKITTPYDHPTCLPSYVDQREEGKRAKEKGKEQVKRRRG